MKPPKLEKQFLISPPASPPEGWAPIREDGPCREQPGLHFELVARLAALAEGQSHEIIEPSPMAPAIVLHACEVSAVLIETEIDILKKLPFASIS